MCQLVSPDCHVVPVDGEGPLSRGQTLGHRDALDEHPSLELALILEFPAGAVNLAVTKNRHRKANHTRFVMLRITSSPRTLMTRFAVADRVAKVYQGDWRRNRGRDSELSAPDHGMNERCAARGEWSAKRAGVATPGSLRRRCHGPATASPLPPFRSPVSPWG